MTVDPLLATRLDLDQRRGQVMGLEVRVTQQVRVMPSGLQ